MKRMANRLVAWCRERESIRVKKEQGLPRPWTKDPILDQFRFCNVYREHDKVTRWFATNWRQPHELDPDLWFAFVVGRHINSPETLAEIGYPVPWTESGFLPVMARRAILGKTSYNAAYMIRAKPGVPGQSKAGYLAEMVFGPLWQRRTEIRPRPGDTLRSFYDRLCTGYGMGSFMAAQVVADMKYVGPLRNASDWWEFAASGPGSRRGLNRMLGCDPRARWSEDDWLTELGKLRQVLKPKFNDVGLPWCHAQDTQNQLCELDKYERARLGQGRPKQRY